MKRIEWIDNCKFICIMFVLLSHMSYTPIYLKIIYKPIFLTTFFFITGYNLKVNKNIKSFLQSKIKSIFIPAFIFSIIYIIDFKSILNRNYSFSLFVRDISGLVYQQRGNGDVLWFLWVSLEAEIIIWIIYKYIKNEKLIIFFITVIMLISIIYTKHYMKEIPYWYLNIIGVAMFFMMLGIEYHKNEEKINLLEIRKFLVPTVIVYLVLTIGEFMINDSFININEYEANICIWLLTIIVGIFVCVELSKKMKSNKIINFIGANTILFYIFHDRVRNLIEIVIFRIQFIRNMPVSVIGQSILCIIMLVFECCILYVLSIIILKYIPWIVGKRKISNQLEV